jgi:tellurite resistance protein
MPSRNTCKYLSMTQAGLAAYMHDRAVELFDAIITAAAIVARADGRIDSVERSQLLGFLNRNGFLAGFTREEVVNALEDRTRQLAERCGAEVAIGGLSRLAGRSVARLVVDAGTHVAAADGRLHPGELHTLALIRTALGRHCQSRPSTLSLS